ncbi:TonB-dependent receptor [Mucilaginibacter gynuensis]|uniref:TonB-dependent receptor n=1 Tax=Mucilaginibacter gynuensis TaxID=1302236 RepID=A0ABP8GEY4_9SPHI
MKKLYTTLLLTIPCLASFAQSESRDTSKTLDEVIIFNIRKQKDISRMDSIKGTFIYSGKKNEVIKLANKDAALTEKFGRQIFAKIPGVFVYDMDGTGNQTNISTRGLDPHRGWEFNIRKDGVITNSDMYGYPASHYNIPLEAVERIELVRGTGSLQYGAQFGGMLNYVSKQPGAKELAFESVNTVGSYGLLSTYNSINGTKGKFRYYAWFNNKKIDGYRRNSDSKFNAQDITLYYDASPSLLIKAEWTRSDYVTHLAGPLTDAMFNADPRMSTRSRNYYSPEINVPSISVDWKAGRNTLLKLTTSAIIGARKSVLFDKPTTTVDVIDPVTLQYANRQVDIDHFNSYTTELRLLQTYSLFNLKSSLAAGIQYMNNNLHRQQLGKGTTGDDYDLSLVTPGWGRDMHYKTNNIALFAENRFALTRNLSVNTGVRVESGETNMTGTINNYPANDVPNTIKHRFPLFGVNAQYAVSSNINAYAGWSQAYRPVIFKDIIPTSVYELADKNLKDARGYNLEAGFRGNWKILQWDVSYFQLLYKNRLGTLAQKNSAGDEIIFRTNIGNSLARGVEVFTQADLPLGRTAVLSVFTATAYMNAVYKDANVRSGNTNVNIDGNKVESAPEWQSRNGVTLKVKRVSVSALYSYTGNTFADALNSVIPTATGSAGLVPAYHLFDFNSSVFISSHLQLRLNLNNAFNRQYFTKRPQFYPGPGIWPSDGRLFSTTLVIKL